MKEVMLPSGSVPPDPGGVVVGVGVGVCVGVGVGVGVGGKGGSTGVSLMVVVTVALGWEPLLLLLLGSGVVDRLWEVFEMPLAGTIKVTWRFMLLPLGKREIVGKVTIPVTGS